MKIESRKIAVGLNKIVQIDSKQIIFIRVIPGKILYSTDRKIYIELTRTTALSMLNKMHDPESDEMYNTKYNN